MVATVVCASLRSGANASWTSSNVHSPFAQRIRTIASWRSVRLTVGDIRAGGLQTKTTLVIQSDTPRPVLGFLSSSWDASHGAALACLPVCPITSAKCLPDALLRPAPARRPQGPANWTASSRVAIVCAPAGAGESIVRHAFLTLTPHLRSHIRWNAVVGRWGKWKYSGQRRQSGH